MNLTVLTTLERLLTTLWVGALWAIGYLAVPILFFQQDDRMLAGALAGHMFTTLSYIGLVTGSALLAILFLQRGARWRRSRFVVVLAMLALVMIGEFLIQPQMADLKRVGLLPGSATAARFALLHGIASILYLINSVLGMLLVVFGNGAALNRAEV